MSNEGAPFIECDPDARFVHAINSQLLHILFGSSSEAGQVESLLIDKSSWIINTLYFHKMPHPNADPALKTSSTLCKGVLYDHSSRKGGDVQSLDESVPLASSICGRCLLSDRPIWLGKAQLKFSQDAFASKYYRRFALVDVNTEGFRTPDAEIVFPIASRQGNVFTGIGVLNLELFGDTPSDSDAYIRAVPWESVNDFFDGVLGVHAGFLKIATDMLDHRLSRSTRSETHHETDTAITHMLGLHRVSIETFLKRQYQDIAYLNSAMREVASAMSGVAARHLRTVERNA